MNWPLGRVVELLPGRDNVVRLVRLWISNGELLRPVQRLYPLECSSAEDKQLVTKKQPGHVEKTQVREDKWEPVDTVVNSIPTDVKSRVE